MEFHVEFLSNVKSGNSTFLQCMLCNESDIGVEKWIGCNITPSDHHGPYLGSSSSK